MKIRKNILFFVAGFALFLCLAAGVYFIITFQSAIAKQTAALAKGREQLQQWQEQSQTEIEAFFQTEPEEVFEAPRTLHASQYQPQQSEQEETPLYQFTAPEGFTIESYSKAWNAQKLEQLYDELMSNQHGQEIEYLKSVILSPATDGNILGYHWNEEETDTLYFYLPAAERKISFTMQNEISNITLLNCDKYTTIESVAMTLSHEYGHHYTIYYMLGDDSYNSEYTTVRDLPKDRVVSFTTNDDKYYEQYIWVIEEIAANDYVMLMGSPNAHAAMYWYDIQQALDSNKENDMKSASLGINLLPQANMNLPLATEVTGLGDYFYSFIDQQAPTPQYEKKSIALTIEKSTKSFNLTRGYTTFNTYTIRWNKPYSDSGVIYSVIALLDEDQPVPIKTVKGTEAATAITGTAVSSSQYRVNWISDYDYNGKVTFLVTALFPDGTVYLSEPLVYDFK